MLTFHKMPELGEIVVALEAPSLPPDVSWVDALAPAPEEIGFLRRVLGVEPPTLAQMLEIESSSRLYRSHGALFATLPIARRGSSGASATSPLGFVLTPSALLRVHYEPVTACAPEKVTATSDENASLMVAGHVRNPIPFNSDAHRATAPGSSLPARVSPPARAGCPPPKRPRPTRHSRHPRTSRNTGRRC
jgi:hypothetical protein